MKDRSSWLKGLTLPMFGKIVLMACYVMYIVALFQAIILFKGTAGDWLGLMVVFGLSGLTLFVGVSVYNLICALSWLIQRRRS